VECILNKFTGPPGTGKTYVGLRIMHTFLENLFDKMPSRRLLMLQNDFMENIEMSDEEENILPKQLETPILVVCYTNHALDQFLEGILKFHHSHSKVHYPTLNLASLTLTYKTIFYICIY